MIELCKAISHPRTYRYDVKCKKKAPEGAPKIAIVPHTLWLS